MQMKKHQHIATSLIGLILSQSNALSQNLTGTWLGAASPYAVLGATTVTNTGNSVITGDLGLSPGTSITGFPPGLVSGAIHTNDASASQARADALLAYNGLTALMATGDLSGQDLGQTLTAGIYRYNGSAELTGTLTLDGTGEFIFLIGSTLTTSSASAVSLINGADAANVAFRVGSSATLGSTSTFAGTIIADISITATTGTDVRGRLIALNGAVTLDNNNVIVPEPSSAILLLTGLGFLLTRRRA